MIRRKIVWADKGKAKELYDNKGGRGVRELRPNGLRKLRKMIRYLEEELFDDLRTKRPYNFELLTRDLKGHHSMRYNRGRRLVFRFIPTADKGRDEGCVVVITDFEGHYGEK